MNLYNHDTFIPLTQYVNSLVGGSSYVITTHNDKASQYCHIYFLLYFMLNTVKCQHDNVICKSNLKHVKL